MAYNFGQYLSNPSSDYLNNIPKKEEGASGTGYYIKEIHVPISSDSTITNDGQGIFYQMTQGNYYYLNVKIKKIKTDARNNITGEQNITVRLAHTGGLDNDRQVIKTFVIPAATEDDQYESIDFVIAPNDSYQVIQFILSKVASYDERKLQFEEDPKYYTFINILTRLTEGNIRKLKQIGIQGQTGLQMCINGESIKIGRTKIYEINDGYEVTFLGFVYEPSDTSQRWEPFILDYQY